MPFTGASVLCLSPPLVALLLTYALPRSGQSHPGLYVCTRNRTSSIAVEEPPSSRDPTTRPLRRSPRHPRLSLRRRCLSSCGAETHLLFSGHSAIDASDTSARAAPGAHVGQPAPKAASEVSHEARRSSEECVRSARTAPPRLRIATIRHGFKVFVLILPCFFGGSFFG